jgi:hypothetical protein
MMGEQSAAIRDYFHLVLDENFGVTLHVSLLAVGVLLLLGITIFAVRFFWSRRLLLEFEIDEAEFGLGDQKIRFKPNDMDRTVAYRIWVELSTRKIGLPIDPEHDVIDEIYTSWYNFFAVTRELIKDVPVRKVRQSSTEKIINLSIEVLNSGLRPHLTRWQARFRRWYSWQLTKDSEAILHPQDIQKKFPDYTELIEDMIAVNQRLIAYRRAMYKLVTGL